MIIERLKRLDTDGPTLDELVEFSALGKVVRAEYEAHAIEVPGFVDDGMRQLTREINNRRADDIAKKLAQKRALAERLQTPDEKRKKNAEEIAALEAQQLAIK